MCVQFYFFLIFATVSICNACSGVSGNVAVLGNGENFLTTTVVPISGLQAASRDEISVVGGDMDGYYITGRVNAFTDGRIEPYAGDSNSFIFAVNDNNIYVKMVRVEFSFSSCDVSVRQTSARYHQGYMADLCSASDLSAMWDAGSNGFLTSCAAEDISCKGYGVLNLVVTTDAVAPPVPPVPQTGEVTAPVNSNGYLAAHPDGSLLPVAPTSRDDIFITAATMDGNSISNSWDVITTGSIAPFDGDSESFILAVSDSSQYVKMVQVKFTVNCLTHVHVVAARYALAEDPRISDVELNALWASATANTVSTCPTCAGYGVTGLKVAVCTGGTSEDVPVPGNGDGFIPQQDQQVTGLKVPNRNHLKVSAATFDGAAMSEPVDVVADGIIEPYAGDSTSYIMAASDGSTDIQMVKVEFAFAGCDVSVKTTSARKAPGNPQDICGSTDLSALWDSATTTDLAVAPTDPGVGVKGMKDKKGKPNSNPKPNNPGSSGSVIVPVNSDGYLELLPAPVPIAPATRADIHIVSATMDGYYITDSVDIVAAGAMAPYDGDSESYIFGVNDGGPYIKMVRVRFAINDCTTYTYLHSARYATGTSASLTNAELNALWASGSTGYTSTCAAQDQNCKGYGVTNLVVTTDDVTYAPTAAPTSCPTGYTGPVAVNAGTAGNYLTTSLLAAPGLTAYSRDDLTIESVTMNGGSLIGPIEAVSAGAVHPFDGDSESFIFAVNDGHAYLKMLRVRFVTSCCTQVKVVQARYVVGQIADVPDGASLNAKWNSAKGGKVATCETCPGYGAADLVVSAHKVLRHLRH